MAEDHVFVATLEDGKRVQVKACTCFQRFSCGDPNCRAIHIVSFNAKDEPICETSFSKDQLLGLLTMDGKAN